jgi:hypothetical protein
LRHLEVNEFEVESAGTRPSVVNPAAIKVWQKSALIFQGTGQNKERSFSE